MNLGSVASVFRGIDWQLFLVRTLNVLNYCWDVFKKQSLKSSRFLLDSFSPNVYVFFEGSSIPVAARDYKQTAAGTPAVAAYYDRDTQGIHTDLTSTNPHTLLFDSVNVYHRDINLYDLTDFFNDTKFYGVAPASLDTWVAAWCLNTSIYLDRKKSFTIRCKQFLEDDVKTFSLWSTDEEEKQEWARMCRPTGVFHHQPIRRVDVSGNTVCMPTTTATPTEDTSTVETSTLATETQEQPSSTQEASVSSVEEESSKVE